MDSYLYAIGCNIFFSFSPWPQFHQNNLHTGMQSVVSQQLQLFDLRCLNFVGTPFVTGVVKLFIFIDKTQKFSPILLTTYVAPTNTLTGSFTVTKTQIPTVTTTSSGTLTLAKTATFSATLTSIKTVTLTNTNSYTSTPSNTLTGSFTIIKTPTATNTPSGTLTSVDTTTYSTTLTSTNSQTVRPSNTLTGSFTITKTPINTLFGTSTLTSVDTMTYSSTLTGTNSQTVRLSDTLTGSFTVTKTPKPIITTSTSDTTTSTITLTKIGLIAYGNTLTSSFTFTITKTPKPTVIPTISSTATLSGVAATTATSSARAKQIEINTNKQLPDNQKNTDNSNLYKLYVPIASVVGGVAVCIVASMAALKIYKKRKARAEMLFQYNSRPSTFDSPPLIQPSNQSPQSSPGGECNSENFQLNSMHTTTSGSQSQPGYAINLATSSTISAGNQPIVGEWSRGMLFSANRANQASSSVSTFNQTSMPNVPAVTGASSNPGCVNLNLNIDKKDIVKQGQIGRGSYAVVYKGNWHGEDVAIKEFLTLELTGNFLDEFQKEVTIMAQYGAQCSKLVRLCGVSLEKPYSIVMELCPNGSLYSWLHNSANPLDWTLKHKFAQDIAQALTFLHKHQVIHRDVKSLNVLLDSGLNAKLSDYSLAKIKNHGQTTTKSTATQGTLLWMAPELFSRGNSYSEYSDVYSYGIVLWEIASRKAPFADEDYDAGIIIAWIIQGQRETIPEDCPKYFAELITRCWAQISATRPKMSEVLDQLNKTAPPKLTI